MIQRRGASLFPNLVTRSSLDVADNHLYQIASQADSEPQVLMSGKDWITKLAVSSSGEIAAGEVSGGIIVSDFNPQLR